MSKEPSQQRPEGIGSGHAASNDQPTGQPDDWPFQTLNLGEYFSYARKAARLVREQRIEFAQAVEIVLSVRTVTERERQMLERKARSIVYLGLEDE